MRKVIEDYTNTWKLITIFSTLITVISVLLFGFSQRAPIIEALTGHKVFVKNKALRPGSESKKQLESFVEGHTLIVGLNIGHADFEANTRESAFNYSKYDDINKAWDTTEGTVTPLFTNDTMHNSRLVQLINGQFVCSETRNTVAATLHPVLNRYSKMTCSIAIPPGFGDFVGWINIYLTDAPSFAQMEKLQELSREIASEVYQRDVMVNDRKGTINLSPFN